MLVILAVYVLCSCWQNNIKLISLHCPTPNAYRTSQRVLHWRRRRRAFHLLHSAPSAEWKCITVYLIEYITFHVAFNLHHLAAAGRHIIFSSDIRDPTVNSLRYCFYHMYFHYKENCGKWNSRRKRLLYIYPRRFVY